MKFWTLTNSSPTRAANYAKRAEAAGWDGIMVVDSQNLSGDSYVALTAMALATKGIEIGTGVTNPVTRHPAVTASAITAIQRLSGGRACLGIGRGDSALAHLGKAPAKVSTLKNYLAVLQEYLRGNEVPFDQLSFSESVAPDVATLGLADTPDASQLKWISPRDIKVPVEVASTGPRVIETAATLGDRVMFALGADIERLKWGVHTALETAERLGRYVELGAYVNIVCHDDVAVARQLVQGGLSTFARFSVMHGDVKGSISKEQKKVLEQLHSQYDMKKHTRTDSSQANALTPDFIDQYAIVGSASDCIDRLKEIESLGISKIAVIGPSAGADRELSVEAELNLATKVLSEF
jgi:5,10-methylenetetrahydromethanopterin reductase